MASYKLYISHRLLNQRWPCDLHHEGSDGIAEIVWPTKSAQKDPLLFSLGMNEAEELFYQQSEQMPRSMCSSAGGMSLE